MTNKTKYINRQLVGVRQSSWFFPLILLILVQASCKKLVDIPPPTQTLAENKIYATDATAIGVLDGIYTTLTNDDAFSSPFQGRWSIGLFAGLSADELSPFATTNPYYTYFRNDLKMIASSSGSELWTPLYNYVYKCNAAIEGLQKSTSLTSVVNQQLLGEAKFMRAFFYFYLVNLFGDVPLALSTDAAVNTTLSRSFKTDVYKQIITDLKEAKDLMNSNYPDATLLGTTSERIRPTRWAAEALLARVYLFTGDYADAEVEASVVINNISLYELLPSLNDVFFKNSKEAIWQLQPTANNLNTVEGRMYVIPPTGPGSSNLVSLSKSLLNSFEVGDQRAMFRNWVDTTIYKKTSTTYDTVPYSFKYKIYASPSVTSASSMTEYFMVLRLGEQYLIRAEARAQLNKINEAKSDLNAIRTRAGLSNTTANDQSSLLTAILNERRHELFCEWGHRWLDLKRTGKVDSVMNIATSLKSNGAIQWRSYQQYYPINQSELNKAPNLTQTDGY
jgi:hypothetical protein